MPMPVDVSRFIRAHCQGVLQANALRRQVRLVTERARGTLILPLERAELEADELVLFVPDEGDGGAQLLVSVTSIEEGRSTDRWLAYHGSPDAPHWCELRLDAARLHHELVDAPVDLTCAFADGEPALCKRANANTPALSEVCARFGVHDPAPVLVGVDPDGFDIRARTGIVRVEFDTSVSTAEEAAEAVDQVIGVRTS